jgi:hypothetical protein
VKLRTLSLPLVVGISLTLVPLAEAEIFKCAGHRNVPTYQNFPCEFDSLGAASMSGSPLAAPATSEAAGADTNRNTRVTQGGPNAAPAPAPRPSVGMTSDEVRRIWGEPAFTTTEEYAKKDIQVWSYADSRSIEFDRDERVTAFRW